LDDELLEVADVVDAAGDVDGILEILTGRRWRHPDDAGRNLLALLLDRIDHVAWREPARLQLVGIHPDSHRILAGAEDVDVADARDAGELVLQVDDAVVGEK